MEFNDHIWSRHEKCIKISTNIPGIGSVNREITIKMSECPKATTVLLSKTNARVLSVFN